MADCVADVLWIMKLLKEMKIPIVDIPTIWCDNTGAVALSANPVLHNKSKHFELDLHFIREKVAADLLHVGYVPSFDQVADVLTKAQASTLFYYCRKKLNVESLDAPSLDDVLVESDDDVDDMNVSVNAVDS